MCALGNKADTKGQVLYDSTYIVTRVGKFLETKWSRGYRGLEEGGNRELPLNAHRVSVWDDGKVLEVDGGGDCTTPRVCLLPPNYALKNGQNGTFYAILPLTF